MYFIRSMVGWIWFFDHRPSHKDKVAVEENLADLRLYCTSGLL